MKTKTWWHKLPTDEKIIVILFGTGFTFLVLGLIMLLSIRVNIIENGFNFIYLNGVINALTYNHAGRLTVNIFFLKIGTIFTVFLMPICAGCSIIWFMIKRLILKNNY